METPIALHSVAHRVSHQIPAESEMSRQNRATPPQIKVSHLSLDPPVALSSHSQQAGARRAGGWYRGTFGFRKRIALGGIEATVTPVALLCATKQRVRQNLFGAVADFSTVLKFLYLPKGPRRTKNTTG